MHSSTPAIELRHLRYFLAVVEELHFGRAAERLHIAQPPLSQAIRRLEDELGVQLFNRTSRVVTLTAAGDALATQAAAVLATLDLAVAEARRAGGWSDVLRAGCIPDLPLERLQAFVEAVRASEFGVRPQMIHLDAPEQVTRLRRGELDIGIFHDVGEVGGLEAQPLFAGEPLGAFVRGEHPLAEKCAVRPEDVRSEMLITYPSEGNPVLHDRLLKILERGGFEFAAMSEVSSKYARDLLLAAAEGIGVAVAPVSLTSASEAGRLVLCRPLDPQVSMPDTVVAWRANPPRHLGAVLANVRAVARQLRGSAPVP